MFSKLVLGQKSTHWQITERNSILWDLTKEAALPHHDNIEMSGQLVSAILSYDIDENKYLSLKRDVIFPQLRTYTQTNEPDWKQYRAYFRRTIGDEIGPRLLLDEKIVVPGPVDSVEIGGMIHFYHRPVKGLQITRTLFPAMSSRLLVEKWTLTNVSDINQAVDMAHCNLSLVEKGYKGRYAVRVLSKGKNQLQLQPGESYTFPLFHGATLNEETSDGFDLTQAEKERTDFLTDMQSRLVLESLDPVINTLFYFSKIRASESIFQSSMGLVHSPGGGNYYLGIWANDQVEYSGPFFPYLGYQTGNTAAYNTYAHFQKNIPTDDSHIPYAFEVDGNFVMDHLDRVDAAMIAFGAAHYVLANGDLKTAEELWPLIEWSLKWCHEHRNEAGAVISESDEMEGRIETGTANLSTSSLYYGGLNYGARLAKALGKKKEAKAYQKQAADMAQVIESYFGASLENLDTYRYFDSNQHLRHWICLPLCMGIETRKEGTLNALFDELWTENGILVEKRAGDGPKMFWDRATLYAMRGAMKIGETDRAFDKLKAFSKKRLLGEHVPYVIEAWPENNMKHLSAESALYCRIITEGLLGIEPTGLGQIQLSPNLPQDWGWLRLRNVALQGKATDFLLEKGFDGLRLVVSQGEKTLFDQTILPHQRVDIELKN
ncbi:MAG: six-hairpin glycosidase-like protein [Bacteroidota bacterium]